MRSRRRPRRRNYAFSLLILVAAAAQYAAAEPPAPQHRPAATATAAKTSAKPANGKPEHTAAPAANKTPEILPKKTHKTLPDKTGTALAPTRLRVHPVGPAEPAARAKPGAADTDLSGAVPASEISRLPSTASQMETLRSTIAEQKPKLQGAEQTRDSLQHQAEDLHQRLVKTATQVQALEDEKIHLDQEIPRLAAENAALSAGLARDRAALARLTAILERLQHDMPPAMVLKSDDVLGAARASMLMGATLPDIYRRAAVLARRIGHTRAVRRDLIARRQEAVRNTAALTRAEAELSRLLAERQAQAAGAAEQYDELKKRFDVAADRAASLQMLMDEAAVLRSTPAAQGIVTVTAQGSGDNRLRLRIPASGQTHNGGMDGVGGADAPGQTITTLSSAQVVSPGDGGVLYAGPYQKSGLVLILELANGYDAVLAGLGRIDVRLGDRVLAGEPVGRMPAAEDRPPRLYIELRHNGRGINPAPFMETGSRKAKKS